MTDLYMNSNWGPTLLTTVARGSSIICELCRLADYIPNEYKYLTKHEYSEILCDFSYFSTTEAFEYKIESKSELQDLDEKFKDNHIQLLERFYRLFESIYRYISDLNHFLVSLEDGHFVQHDLVSVMQDEDGKQLMCEALYLYGSMMLLIDQKIEGSIREKILISFYRYSSKQSNLDSNTEDVCQLLRSTGFNINLPINKRPADYPESFFKRIPVDARYVSMVLDKLRSDDFYHQTLAYPMPEHRSVARATQANMLYVCLFFAPNILHNQPSLMREIVDKHFSDNWVLGGYMGHIVNLVDCWTPYKAANTALANTIEISNVKSLAKRHMTLLIQKLLPGMDRLLTEGVLVKSYVLDKVSKLMDRVRECNVTLRWLMLHTAELSASARSNKRCVQLREAVFSASATSQNGGSQSTIVLQEEDVFKLLVMTSQFELKLGDCLADILESRQDNWNQLREESVGRMTELSEVFSGSRALARVQKNEKLQKWFEKLADQIRNLDPDSSTSGGSDDGSSTVINQSATAAGRTLDQLVQALKEVLEYHQLDTNIVVKQFIQETCSSLQQMMRLLHLQDRLRLDLSICGDLGYALNIVDRYTGFMQDGLMKDPFLAIQLRSVFLKLASSLDSPLIRLNQCNSRDLISVTQYYSSELVHYVRRVLQIIPKTMFSKMADIVQLQTSQLKELPTRLEKDKIKDFVQYDYRAKVAKLTHDISVFTQGILMMKTTLVGIIELDPHKLLEDGIRKELVIHVSKAFETKLTFNTKGKFSDLESKLTELSSIMDGYRRSFEYIQDYINIYGLQMWREEVSRIINFNVERECNVFLKLKVPEYRSTYQSKTIPIPVYPQVDGFMSFIGRLLSQLLKVTDPKIVTYIPHLNAWYEIKTKAEVANMKIFSILETVFNSFGLASFDRLIGLLIVKELQKYLKLMNRLFKDSKIMASLDSFLKSVNPISKTVNPRVYSDIMGRLSKSFQSIVDLILWIGHLQLLRHLISTQLGISCEFEAKYLHSALMSLNTSLLTDLERHVLSPSTVPYPGCIGHQDNTENRDGFNDLNDDTGSRISNSIDPDTNIVYLTNKLLQATGLHDPVNQVYITSSRFKFSSVLPALSLISVLNRLAYSKQADCSIAKKSSQDQVDAHVLTLGIVTLMAQMHPVVTKEWLGLVSQYVKSVAVSANLLQSSKNTVNVTFPSELVNCVLVMENFCLLSNKPISLIHNFIPAYLVDDIRTYARTSE